MAYERNNWSPGKFITSAGLNHMEDGIDELQNTKAERYEVQDIAVQVEQQNHDLEGVHDELASVHDDIGEMERRLTMKAEQNDVAGIAQKLDRAGDDLEALDDRVKTKAERNELADVAASLSRTQGEIDALKEADAYTQQEIAAINTSSEMLDGQIREINKTMNQKADVSMMAGIAVVAEQKADREETDEALIMRTERTIVGGLFMDVEQLSGMVAAAEQSVNGVLGQIADLDSAVGRRVAKPAVSPDGTRGQVLSTNGDGTTTWTNPTLPTDEQIGNAVSDWLDDHPEATTTVEDGTITEEKLAPEVLAKIENGSGNEEAANAIISYMSAMNGRSQEIEQNVATMNAWQHRLTTHAMRYADPGYGFLYFTDPHGLDHFPFGHSPYDLMDDLRFIRTIHEHSPAKYVLCGGDWLNVDYRIPEMARKVGRVQNLMHTEIGPDAWTVFGNHDDGMETSASTRLATSHVARMWYGRDKLYFVLDCGEDVDVYMLEMVDSTNRVSDTQWEQLAWMAAKLQANTKPHLFGIGHIILGGEGRYFGEAVCQLIDAFNRKSSITLHGATYQFSGSTGTFHFLLAGHYHMDYETSYSNVPVIWTVDFATTRAIELSYADWDAGTLHLDRVGAGASRTINIIPTGGYVPAS